jgi:hypothetical protein
MRQQLIIESLAMDLKRTSLGLYRGSVGTAKKFREEAIKREEELSQEQLDPYLKNLVRKIRQILQVDDPNMAEQLLMYSILFQNVAVTRFHS